MVALKHGSRLFWVYLIYYLGPTYKLLIKLGFDKKMLVWRDISYSFRILSFSLSLTIVLIKGCKVHELNCWGVLRIIYWHQNPIKQQPNKRYWKPYNHIWRKAPSKVKATQYYTMITIQIFSTMNDETYNISCLLLYMHLKVWEACKLSEWTGLYCFIPTISFFVSDMFSPTQFINLSLIVFTVTISL